MVCPGNITAVTELGDCGAQVNYTSPFSEIAEGELRQVQHNYSPKDRFDVGETTVYYKAADQQSNSYFCLFRVKVNDQEKPEFINFPEDVEVESPSTSGTIVKWTAPEAEDNCGELNVFSDYESGDVFPVGETEVTYWVTDLAGNVTTQKFLVKVVKSPELLTAR